MRHCHICLAGNLASTSTPNRKLPAAQPPAAAKIPDGIHTLDLKCMQRCGLTPADFSSTGQFGDGICAHLPSVFQPAKST